MGSSVDVGRFACNRLDCPNWDPCAGPSLPPKQTLPRRRRPPGDRAECRIGRTLKRVDAVRDRMRGCGVDYGGGDAPPAPLYWSILRALGARDPDSNSGSPIHPPLGAVAKGPLDPRVRDPGQEPTGPPSNLSSGIPSLANWGCPRPADCGPASTRRPASKPGPPCRFGPRFLSYRIGRTAETPRSPGHSRQTTDGPLATPIFAGFEENPPSQPSEV